MDERTRLLTAYARALGLRSAIPSGTSVAGALGLDLNEIISTVSDVIGEISEQFKMKPNYFWGQNSVGTNYCDPTVVLSKTSQFISYLEHIHHLNSTIIEIGSLFNSIKNAELKSRCSDLLSAPGNFDRAINQATLVLEDKIRSKAGIDKILTGPNLVNAAINSNPQKGLLRVSPNDEEHEGIGHICRGIMLAFRNPTHHHLSDAYTREDALKLCAFIDNLVSAVENAAQIVK